MKGSNYIGNMQTSDSYLFYLEIRLLFLPLKTQAVILVFEN